MAGTRAYQGLPSGSGQTKVSDAQRRLRHRTREGLPPERHFLAEHETAAAVRIRQGERRSRARGRMKCERAACGSQVADFAR